MYWLLPGILVYHNSYTKLTQKSLPLLVLFQANRILSNLIYTSFFPCPLLFPLEIQSCFGETELINFPRRIFSPWHLEHFRPEAELQSFQRLLSILVCWARYSVV